MNPLLVTRIKGRFLIDAPYHNGRYDGDVIWETKDCLNCDFLHDAICSERIIGVCIKGVAWKVIVPNREGRSLRKCDKKQKGNRNAT